MENLNAEQVKKALECCTLGDCTPCPYHQLYVGCRDRMAEDALALINSQEQRIGELAEENERVKTQKYYIHTDGRIEMIPTVESVRADTVRKMQERLDKRFCHDPAFLGVEQRLIMDVIDQIAKEMEGVDEIQDK